MLTLPMMTKEEQVARYKASVARTESAAREYARREPPPPPPVKVIDLTWRKLDMAERERRERQAEQAAAIAAVIAETRAKVLAELGMTEEQIAEPKIGDLVLLVADVTGVAGIDIRSQRRSEQTVKARQIVMWLARWFTSRSLPSIGRRMGGRDHSTVLHGVRKVDALIAGHVGRPAEENPQAWAEHLWRADWRKASRSNNTPIGESGQEITFCDEGA